MAISALDKIITIEGLAAFLHFWARLVVLIRKPFIIGITGSAGKTTTTAMIASVLKQPDAELLVGKVGFSEKNMNDDVGLPATLLLFGELLEEYPPSRLFTLLRTPFRVLQILTGTIKYPHIFVLEFGAGWGGHMANLVSLAPPNVAVVTTIGPAHLDRLKTLEGVVDEKIELVRAIPPSGLVILGTEHDYVSRFAQAARSAILEVSGRGAALAESATRAICQHLNIPDSVTTTGIREFSPPKGRLNVVCTDRMTLIDDSYNANPLSMKYGLDILVETCPSGARRVAVLGFMGELGELASQYHKEIGDYARHSVEFLIGVGELSKNYDPDLWFESSEVCAEHIESLLRPDDCVLVKGSASSSMKIVANKLKGSVRIGIGAGKEPSQVD